MKKNQKRILYIAIGISALYVVWLLIKKARGNALDGEVYNDEYEMEALESGCHISGYSLGTIDYNSPSANLNKCGEAIKTFQVGLNTLADGCDISEDGAYGPNTKTCHENLLDGMGGTWSLGVI